MRSLKYAILGLLCREPLTGYDIMKAFEKGLGSFWRAKHGQIYPELKKLAEEGMVTFSAAHGTKKETKVYHITEAGRENFSLWLRLDEPLEPTPKDVFKLRVFLSETMRVDELLPLLSSQAEKRQAKLERQQKYHAFLFGDTPPEQLTRVQLGDHLALTGSIMREQAYLEWLQNCADILHNYPE